MLRQDVERLQGLYKSGRYECDVWFHEKLMQLIQQMEMFDFIPSLEENTLHVKKIHQLISQTSDSLREDFDEGEATKKADQIKEQICKIKSKKISDIMSHLERQKYLSYTDHAINLIQKCNYHPKYQSILQNLMNTVYDPKVRLEHILVCALFMLRNTGKIEEILMIYEKSIEGTLKIMKYFRINSQNLKELVTHTIKKLNESKKTKEKKPEDSQNWVKTLNIANRLQNYCFGIYFIYSTAIKLCDLIKILEGKNNFILKLNSYKPDVEEIIEMWEHADSCSGIKNKLKSIEKQLDYFPVKQLQELFLGDKSGIQKINQTCKICLRYIHKNNQGVSESVEHHKVCQSAVKELMRPRNNSTK